MSENQEAQIIKLPIDEQITDEDFQVFMTAFLGPYKGSGYNPE